MKPDEGSPGPRAPIINDRHPLGHVGPAIAISKGFFFFFLESELYQSQQRQALSRSKSNTAQR